MAALRKGAVSYKRGTPVPPPVPPGALSTDRACADREKSGFGLMRKTDGDMSWELDSFPAKRETRLTVLLWLTGVPRSRHDPTGGG